MIWNILQTLGILLLSAILWGCGFSNIPQSQMTISIKADKKDFQIKIIAGSDVQDALKAANISLGELDRVEPALNTSLSDGSEINVIRVRDEYYIEQEVIPFIHQEIRNEALSEGERRLSQPGVNGVQEITYHRVYENDVETSDTVVKTEIITPSLPEVIMVGSKSSFASIDIPGRIAYLSAGNAWVMDQTTANRRLVVPTADLDGRIFSLSPDENYLLFTRKSSLPNVINTLWMVSLKEEPIQLIDLGVSNVVHFAGFSPESDKIAYSTVEWRETSPGWQANNDLFELEINGNGASGTPQMDLDANSGGIYGWWGMDFSWAPVAQELLYTRPDGIGIVDLQNGSLDSILSVNPYQTGGNWAWEPGASWSPDGTAIFAVVSGGSSENSPAQFDLVALAGPGRKQMELVSNVGMFAYPVTSPTYPEPDYLDSSTGEPLSANSYWLAYLQAILPDQSDTSNYRLFVMDRDGSNQAALFPKEGDPGLEPQRIVWSPKPVDPDNNFSIAFIYNGNIWLVDAVTGVARQLTGDGLTNRIDWR